MWLPCDNISTRTLKLVNMHFKSLVGIFSVLISSISAISILNFPYDLRVQPGSELTIQLADNNLSAGEHVRVELWDNQNDEDINAAVLGEDIIVNQDGTVNLSIPSQFPKTKNAFLRVYYKSNNTVSPRFAIKPAANCMNTKTPVKPTILPTPVIIYQSVVTATASPVVVIAGPGAGPAITGTVTGTTGNASVTSTAQTSSAKSSSAARTSTASSTSSASVAKFSAGSLTVVVAVAFAMIF